MVLIGGEGDRGRVGTEHVADGRLEQASKRAGET